MAQANRKEAGTLPELQTIQLGCSSGNPADGPAAEEEGRDKTEEKSMSDTVIVAIITASSSVAVAVTALFLNYRGFSSLESRMANVESLLRDHGERLARIETELKNQSERIAHLEERIPPLIHR